MRSIHAQIRVFPEHSRNTRNGPELMFPPPPPVGGRGNTLGNVPGTEHLESPEMELSRGRRSHYLAGAILALEADALLTRRPSLAVRVAEFAARVPGVRVDDEREEASA